MRTELRALEQEDAKKLQEMLYRNVVCSSLCSSEFKTRRNEDGRKRRIWEPRIERGIGIVLSPPLSQVGGLDNTAQTPNRVLYVQGFPQGPGPEIFNAYSGSHL